MTNKEAAGILISQAIVLGRASGKSTLERIRIEAICKAVEALEKQETQEWISVDDRLPEIGRSVIAYNAPAKCAAEAVYKGEGEFLQFRWAARLQEQEVTHWMPLPEPPKGE